MNAITRHVNEQSAKGFNILVENLRKVSVHLKREFAVTQKDDEIIYFGIDNFPFSLSWGESTRKTIGREVIVPEYQLSIWHTVGGGRWHPPENVDTTLITTQDIHQCITCALETVAKEEIRQCLEGVAFEMMAEEELKVEEM